MRKTLLCCLSVFLASVALGQEPQDTLTPQKSIYDTVREAKEPAKIIPKKAEAPKIEREPTPTRTAPEPKKAEPPAKKVEPKAEPPKIKSMPPAEERAQQPVEPLELQTPADSVVLAAQDIKTLPAAIRPYIRYLSLHNVQSKSQRAHDARVLSGHLNHLHRQVDIIPARPVQGGWLLRVNIAEYGWDVKLWESLANSDPYFHSAISITTETIWVETVWPGGVWAEDGKNYPKGAFTYKEKKQVTNQTALAPWLSKTPAQKAALADLVLYSQSQVPIVRADWFANQTMIQADRNPGFYDFLGIKDEKTFQKIIGFDAKFVDEFGKELRGAVSISGVSQHPRAVVRHNALGGAYWRTFDFKNGKDKENALRVLGKDIENAYNASEQYGLLPSGFWVTGLFDKNGKRQDSAPDFLVSDSMSKSNDKRIHVNASCVRCHDNGGLQDIDEFVRKLYVAPLRLDIVDPQKARDFQQQYFKRMDSFLAKDRAVYTEAVKEATGFTTRQYAAAYAEYWSNYEDAKITTALAARDLGISETTFRKVLVERLKQGLPVDPVVAGFVHQGANAIAIPIRQWEEIYPLTQLLLDGIIP